MKERKFSPSGEGLVQVIAGILFVVLLIIINIVDPTFYPTMWHLATNGSMEEIAEYIQGYGPMAMVVSMLLDIFVNAVVFCHLFLFLQRMVSCLVCGRALLFHGSLKLLG